MIQLRIFADFICKPILERDVIEQPFGWVNIFVDDMFELWVGNLQFSENDNLGSFWMDGWNGPAQPNSFITSPLASELMDECAGVVGIWVNIFW